MGTDRSVPPIRARRRIAGASAVLLVHTADGAVDWDATEAHIERTVAAGLTPAVNMDTGFVQLLDVATRHRVLDITHRVAGRDFVAGAYVADAPGDAFAADRYLDECDAIAARGGTPVIFPSHGLNALDDDALVSALATIGRGVDRFIGFELGTMFVPYGRIYSIDAYRGMLDIATCIGAKHSSLDRAAEWERIVLRDAHRPDFAVMTGNDLAIDGVMWGADYLLGLSTFAPDAFAARDAAWADGDVARFLELNDVLQYLGHFTFRSPVPGYRHNAAQWFVLRGWAAADTVPTAAPTRPTSDVDVLTELHARLCTTMGVDR